MYLARNMISNVMNNNQKYVQINRAQQKIEKSVEDNLKSRYLALLDFITKLMVFFRKVKLVNISLIKQMKDSVNFLFPMFPQQVEVYFLNIHKSEYLPILVSESNLSGLYRLVLNHCFEIVLKRRNVNLAEDSGLSEDKIKLNLLLDSILEIFRT